MRLVLEETVAAPVNTVFQVFTDLHHAADHVEAIQSLEVLGHGPVGKGTRFRETRVMFGKESTEEMEITAFSAPNVYLVEAMSCGAHFATEYRFDARGPSETQVTMTMNSRPVTLMAKLMTPMGFLMKGAMVKMLEKDHAELRAVCEARGAAPAAHS